MLILCYAGIFGLVFLFFLAHRHRTPDEQPQQPPKHPTYKHHGPKSS